MSQDRLTPLQREILSAFFRDERRFFLTGGAALAGFHLGHRETRDLDLFVASPDRSVLDEGEQALRAAAATIGANVEASKTAPDFRRRIVKTGVGAVVVDLVRDPVPQISEKLELEGIRVDTPREILANKLCTLLSRSEIRDLVDVRALERSGLSIEEGLSDAAKKDAGLTPASLSWILSQIQIADDTPIPGEVAPAELRKWLDELRARLTRLSWPG